MASYVIGRVARDSLFLSRFSAVQLPYADIATALAVGVVVAVYIRVGHRSSLRNLLLGSLLLFASNCLLFWVLARFYQLSWLYPVIYVWVGIFGVLAPTQVWTLANHVLTTREARRVFGLVAGGAISGGIFAGLFSKIVAKAFGAESLLLGMAFFLSACLLLVVLIWRQHQESITDTESAEAPAELGPRNLLESARLVFSSSYLRAIAGLIWVSSFVTAVIGWQFKAIAKEFIPAKDHLAAFFGDFTFYAGILALLVQLLLTSRLLRRFGIGLALVGGWLTVAWVARKQYVATLTQSMQEHRLEAERAVTPVLDRTTTDVLAAKLSSADPEEIIYALSVFESGRQQAAHPAIRALLNHPAGEVRKKALGILAAVGDKAVLPQVEAWLQDPDLAVRTEALLYLSHYAHIDPLDRIQQLGDFADFSIRSAMTAFLARPGETQNLEAARQLLASMVEETGPEGTRTRLEAARLLGMLPDEFGTLLSRLIADADVEVVREAIRSVGKLRKRRLVPDLLDRLADPRLVADVTEVLARLGDPIVGNLRDHLRDPTVPIGVRWQIPVILATIGTQSASYALMEHLLDGDTTFRLRMLSGLNQLHRLPPDLKRDTQMLETVLAAEILGHYRSYQILESLGTMPQSDEPVAQAVSESMKHEIERIFQLLELLYPRHDFPSAYIGLQSKKMTVHDNALEFLDNVLKSQLREMLVPLLDGKVTRAERASIANRLVPARIDSPEEAVAALVSSDDPWLRSCGAYAIGTLGLKSLEHELNRCLENPDPLLRETARQAKVRLQASQTANA